MHDDVYRRDAQGRVVDLATSFPDYSHHIINNYHPLGALVGAQTSRANGWASVELFDNDAFGHHVRTETISTTSEHRVDGYTYQSGTERATRIIGDTAQHPGSTPTLNYQKTTFTLGGEVEWAVSQR